MAVREAPAKQDITFHKGGTFTLQIEVLDQAGVARNLTGYSAKAQFRSDVDSVDVLLELTHTSGLVIGGSPGVITMTVTAAQTGAMSWTSGVWDLRIGTGVVFEYILTGGVVVRKTSTQ